MTKQRGPMKIVQKQGPRGRLTVRIPDELYEIICIRAARDRVSINQIILEILSRKLLPKG